MDHNPFPVVSGIDATAQWMWYNPDPVNITNPLIVGSYPFFPSDKSREYYIFRIGPISEVFDNCLDFEEQEPNTANWCTDAVDNMIITTDNNLQYHNVIKFEDGSGASTAINNVDFTGNWLTMGEDGCLCFDYKVDWNEAEGSNAGSAPKIGIYSGSSVCTTTGINNSMHASFLGDPNNPLIQDNVWGHFCLPLEQCSDGQLPSNQYGTWVILDGSVILTGVEACTKWNQLIANVTGLYLFIDYNAQPSELVYFDNFCWICDSCEEYEPDTLNLDCCQYSFNLNNSRGHITNIGYSVTGGTIVRLTSSSCPFTTSPSNVLGTTSGTLNYSPECNSVQGMQVEVLPNTGSGTIHIDWVVTHADGTTCSYVSDFVCHGMPLTRCDIVKSRYLPEPDVNMTGRTFTIFNWKIPVSPIDKVNIDYIYTGTPPEPLPFNHSGGHLQVDNEIGTPYYRLWYQNQSGNYTYFPQDGLPWECINPPLHQTPSDDRIRFNLKYDWTAGWVGKLKFTIHHCDGQECVSEVIWRGKRLWIDDDHIVDMTKLEAETDNQLISFKLKGSKRLPKEIAGVNITVLNPDATIAAATTPLVHGAKRTSEVMDIASTLSDMKSVCFEFNAPLTLPDGEESPKVEVALLREKGFKTNPLFDIEFFDINGDELGHDTISVGAPAGIIENNHNLIALMDIRLTKCVPNPTTDTDNLKLYYDILKADNISIKMYNELGEEIKFIEQSYKDIGSYEINVSTIGLVSGTYYFKMTSSTQTSTLPVVIIK